MSQGVGGVDWHEHRHHQPAGNLVVPSLVSQRRPAQVCQGMEDRVTGGSLRNAGRIADGIARFENE